MTSFRRALVLALASLALACRANVEPRIRAVEPELEPPAAAPGAPAPSETSAEPDTLEALDAPPPRVEYLGREIARTMHWSGADWLLRATRDDEEGAAQMLAALDVRPGDTVCDLGCGNGFHTLRLAQLVGPAGRVLAVDLQPEMLRLLEARALDAGSANVVCIEASAHDPCLPPGSCDLVLMVDVYHELSHPEEVLASVRAALRPGGRLVLVEFRAEDPTVPIKPLHKMSKAQILKELAPNGFELAAEYDELPWQHLMSFRVARRGSSLERASLLARHARVAVLQ